jgi:hypothetical protein
MSKRVILLIALVTLVAGQSVAINPLDRFRIKKPMVRRGNPIPAHILRSPEKMTQCYGPSVLIRQPAATTHKSKFVTQPD